MEEKDLRSLTKNELVNQLRSCLVARANLREQLQQSEQELRIMRRAVNQAHTHLKNLINGSAIATQATLPELADLLYPHTSSADMAAKVGDHLLCYRFNCSNNYTDTSPISGLKLCDYCLGEEHDSVEPPDNDVDDDEQIAAEAEPVANGTVGYDTPLSATTAELFAGGGITINAKGPLKIDSINIYYKGEPK